MVAPTDTVRIRLTVLILRPILRRADLVAPVAAEFGAVAAGYVAADHVGHVQAP